MDNNTLPPIGSLTLSNPFFLAPMEAVNCASFRVLCKRRGASLVYTDMIDVDVFKEEAEKTSPQKAIQKLINPQAEEQPLAIQIGGSNLENILFTIQHVQKHAALIDFNIGCPLGYMLGKKGGCYLMKHPDQLYKLLKPMRDAISTPFTIKIRSGWDESTINAVEIAQEAEKMGVDAVAVHARTRKQRYQKKSDWQLVRKVKEAIKIPVILSGDVLNAYLAKQAFNHTKCDFIMLGRGAQANPSVFTQLTDMYFKGAEPKKAKTTYNKGEVRPFKDFKEWLKFYKAIESRNNFSEIRDHALWAATECRNNKLITKKIMAAKTEKDLLNILASVRF